MTSDKQEQNKITEIALLMYKTRTEYLSRSKDILVTPDNETAIDSFTMIKLAEFEYRLQKLENNLKHDS